MVEGRDLNRVGYAPGEPKVYVNECVLLRGTRIYLVKSLGSEWFLRYKAFYEVKGDGGEACPRGTQS